MSSKKPRSNSSQALRASLKKTFVLIPELNPRIDLERYLKLALTAFDQAVKNTKNKNLTSAYIDFEKFYTLALDRVPLHPSYKSPGSNVKLVEMMACVRKCTASSIDMFEEVLYFMDQEQDKVVEKEMEHRLIDEFDAEEEVKIHSTPVTPNNPIAQQAEDTTTSANYDNQAAENSTSVATSDLSSLTLLSSPSITAPMATLPPAPTNYSALLMLQSPPPPPPLPLSYLQSNISPDELTILTYVLPFSAFHIPPPATSMYDLTFSPSTVMQCFRDDFYTSFTGFLTSLPGDLQMANAALEGNRCFFVHLGIATSIHPFALQAAFRLFAKESLKTPDCWYEEIVRSVIAHGGFVDANALSFLWPVEFQEYRLLFISMSSGQKALFSHFRSNPHASKEVVVLCQKEHFTLLRPCYLPSNEPFKVIDNILSLARQNGLVVQDNEVQVDPSRSVQSYFQAL